MRIHLVFVGKTGFGDLESAIARYVDRIEHYCHIQTHYIKAEKITPSSSESTIREKESERIVKLVGRQGHVTVMDQSGREYDSPGLARFIERLNDSGVSDLWMAVGGPVGVSPELLGRADTVMSLSRLTFPHDLARLMLVEQLYRAFTIIRGEPYHK
jgi:23S rRNA (pseudouridine1915-N3)-methyltransferase